MEWTKETLHDKQYRTTQNLEARIAIHKYGVNPVNFWGWVWEHYHFRDETHILEVGCGTGQFWQACGHRFPAQARLIVTDFSHAMVHKSRHALQQLQQASVSIADVEHLPFRDKQFDHIVCNFMLYHAQSQETALKEIRRVLKPGGQAGFLTTSLLNMKRLWDVGHQIDPNFFYTSRMIQPFCEENAKALLAGHFGSIETDSYDDELRIDNPEVVIGYLRSVLNSVASPPKEQFYQDYTRFVECEIAEQHYFRVKKRTVCYICQ